MMTILGTSLTAFANNNDDTCDFLEVTLASNPRTGERGYVYDGNTFYVDIQSSKRNKECLDKLLLMKKSIKVKHLATPEILWISRECQKKDGLQNQIQCAAQSKCRKFNGKKSRECIEEALCEHSAGIMAREYIKDILMKNSVELRNCTKSKSGIRLSCEVYVKNMGMLADLVIKAGHGVAYVFGTEKIKINYCKKQ